ncbi:ATP-binding protein [Melioribacter sp. OK-6-Me]|uniref:ATP-binding protein n=1 Tax=unclassified Melioribacter TaxID=2627329 RepID=UPI003EDB5530
MENINYEKKSLKLFQSINPDYLSIAKECVAFANAKGGVIAIGIENNQDYPPSNQKIPQDLPENIRKRISELTVNVGIDVTIQKSENGGEWLKIQVLPSQSTIASTTDGRYYIRVSDQCKPVLPDELSRLFTDKSAFIWETKVVQKIKLHQCDQNKLKHFVEDVKQSFRVSDFVKQKSIEELLLYYHFINEDGYLTNLGILWLGNQNQRSNLLYAPVVQFIKYDINGNKIKKLVWDDFSYNPKELIHDIWIKIEEWREGVEISEGIFGRTIIYNYNENVIRELLANAIVHKPYTTRGDIFINLYPDRLEIHNPGLLPLGVTPQNILHQSVRRNEHLSKIFYDLNLMEREGSGYDKIYEILLSEAKKLPEVEEKDDRVVVRIFSAIQDQKVITLIEKIKQFYLLNQKEIICLGIIAQKQSIIATEFARAIQSRDDKQIRNWLGRLIKYEIIKTIGKTKGMKYFINPVVLKNTDLEKTNLINIEPHRLKALIIEDLKNYPHSTIKEIHNRIGKEISIRNLRTCLYNFVKNGEIKSSGSKKFRRYFIDENWGK